jgi:Uma2 family endonuclease
MALTSRHLRNKAVFYPESDGKPTADNTKQWMWIVFIKAGLDLMFKDNPLVFTAGDLLWYPVEGSRRIRQTPDAMVVFGRPKGHRGSYKQWEEDNLAPQVVFEVLSQGNTGPEMRRKLQFYERYDVQEYYQYDPDRIKLEGWIRRGDQLLPIAQMHGWVSPLLGVRFELDRNDSEHELKMYRPDGTPFVDYMELDDQRIEAEQQRHQAEQQRNRVEQRLRQVELEAEQERQKIARLEALLKQHGINPDE